MVKASNAHQYFDHCGDNQVKITWTAYILRLSSMFFRMGAGCSISDLQNEGSPSSKP
jgi:hypothetical protein